MRRPFPHLRASRLRSLSLLAALAALAAGCDDGGGAGGTEGCQTDNDCKGERVCSAGACIDPDAIDPDATDTSTPDGSDDTDATSDVPGDGDDGDTSMPPDLDGDIPPDAPPQCSDGERQCSIGGHVEACSGGRWAVETMCSAGCRAATCAVAGDAGTCNDPLVFAVGQTVESTTDTLYNPNTWSQTCRSAYLQQTGVTGSPTGPESVMRLDVTEQQMLRITMRPLDPTFFALYLRSDCTNPGSEIHGVCGGNAQPTDPYVVESLFAPGSYFLFVDDFGADGGGTGRFELTVEPILLPACGAQVPVPLDVSRPVELEGDTAQGATSEDWNGPECAVVQSTSGRENIYVFALQQRATIHIAATPLEPADSQIAVYLRRECDVRFSQVACGYSAGNGSAVIEEILDAGTWYLLVDDFASSIDEAQTYSLSIDLE